MALTRGAIIVAVMWRSCPLQSRRGNIDRARWRGNSNANIPCPSTGRTTGACPGYRKDHIVALACGGPDAVSNMQWQTVRDAKGQGRVGAEGVRPLARAVFWPLPRAAAHNAVSVATRSRAGSGRILLRIAFSVVIRGDRK